MIPFYALLVSYLIFGVLGILGISHFHGWHTPLQGAVAVMLLLAASAHWGKRRPDLIRMVPQFFPRPDLIVTVTGCLEIAGAIGILFPATSRVASICLMVLLVAMFPANVHAARSKLTIGGKSTPALLVRTVLQLIFLAAIYLAG
ncbi:DoxX family protein [Paenibacillus aceris]|uniref:Membrane protein n=1 Tax=Paenibacillus aceris TaxID=869555 RepID=A0ABS4HW06_9BACL|nr:DoxX family protein [Paenibacillus aceris]MBP1962705.1 putative membrane protein [Paenibacillus aceris]NHW33932.1 hypothetical protein [Paenibacillus aceris]